MLLRHSASVAFCSRISYLSADSQVILASRIVQVANDHEKTLLLIDWVGPKFIQVFYNIRKTRTNFWANPI